MCGDFQRGWEEGSWVWTCALFEQASQHWPDSCMVEGCVHSSGDNKMIEGCVHDEGRTPKSVLKTIIGYLAYGHSLLAKSNDLARKWIDRIDC